LKNKIRIGGTLILLLLWVCVAVLAWASPSQDISNSERRKLAQFPELTLSEVLSGEFAGDFETYTLDQFPIRNTFRQVKSIFHYYVLRQKDNNDIYVYKGYAAKVEYPLNESSVQNAINKFNEIYRSNLKETNANVYFCTIPDKGLYLAQNSGHLAIDYDSMFQQFKSIEWAEYIDITDLLSSESYYYTDAHWRQEKIIPVAQRLCESMGADVPQDDDFDVITIDKPFYGVYYGQAALPMNPEDLHIMSSKYTTSATVFDYETNKKISVYNDNADNSKDLYDVYLHGAKALLKIDNPSASTEKELIVFRDSFGSSIVPLMMGGYKTITVVDIRYMSSQLIEKYIDFDDQDVLFLYSTSVLNNSFTFK
jgi:hypothetical protein